MKFLKSFSYLVIIISFLSIFGWMVKGIANGEKDFGFLTEPVKFIYTFPDMLTQSVEEVKSLPKTFVPTPDSLERINNLESDFLILTSHSDTGDTRSIVLMNLRNDSILHKWNVENPFRAHDRIMNPMLMEDKSIVYSFEGVSGLRRIDSLSNLIWKQDSVFAHHSLTRAANGDLWICSFEPVYYATGLYRLNGRSVFFKDNFITRIDAETGRILFHQSVTNILTENNLAHYILKTQNIKDPLHINDVEPALKTTAYYQKGDVFISARSPSIVIHYRPATNEVLNIIEGPFVSQHDVDFLGDNALAIFNNNYYTIYSTDSKPPPRDSSRLEYAGDFYSDIIRYDFSNDSISFIGDSVFRENEIFTKTEGLMEFVDEDTYFVEEQNTGLIWIIRKDSVLYKNVLDSQHDGYHHLSNWTRIINNYE